jgi:hypothetical protein
MRRKMRDLSPEDQPVDRPALDLIRRRALGG